MKSDSGVILGLIMLAGLLTATPARAEDSAVSCEVPDYLLASESALPKVAEAIKSGHSLEIFCLGVFLAFAGYFILAEVSGGVALHFIVSISGILIMSAAAWLFSWYKHSADKSTSRTKGTGGNADMAGGGA